MKMAMIYLLTHQPYLMLRMNLMDHGCHLRIESHLTWPVSILWNCKAQRKINIVLDLWAASVLKHGGTLDVLPWHNAADLYKTIDAIQHGNCPWKVFWIHYNGPIPENNPLKWMTETYELCAYNSQTLLYQQYHTPDFKDKIHYSPYMQFNAKDECVWSNLMSADFVWAQAVRQFI